MSSPDSSPPVVAHPSSHKSSPNPATSVSKIPWSPINDKYYEDDSSDDDDDDQYQEHTVRVIPEIMLPITPPPPNLVDNIPHVQENMPAPLEEVHLVVEHNLSESDPDIVPEPSIDVTIDDDLDVPQHVVDLADMADEIPIDPSLDAEDYVRQFSPDNQGLDNQDNSGLHEVVPELDQDVQDEEVNS